MRSEMIARGPVPVLERPQSGAALVTEAVAGERLEVVGRRSGWLEVVPPTPAISTREATPAGFAMTP